MTDAEGYFRTDAPFPAGVIWVSGRLHGLELELVRSEFEHLADPEAASPLDVRARLGPTHRFFLVAPPTGSPAPTQDEVDSMHWQARRVDLQPPGGEQGWRWLSARGDGPYWIQYPSSPPDVVRDLRTRLEVRSRDRDWVGEAELAAGVHAPDEPVTVQLRWAHSSLAGRVVEPGGGPLQWIKLSLLPEDEVFRETGLSSFLRDERGAGFRDTHQTVTDELGEYEFQQLKVGRYQLVAEVRGRAPARRTVDVQRGLNAEPDLVLEPLGEGDWIQGRLSTGRPGVPPSAVMRLEPLVPGLLEHHKVADPDHGAMSYVCRIEGDQTHSQLVEGFFPDGSFLFTFDGLSSGPYRLNVQPLDQRSFEPRSLVVHSGDLDVEVVLDDHPDRRELRFRGRSARGIRTLENLRLQLLTETLVGRAVKPERGRRNEVAVDVHAGLRFEWVLQADGHLPARGDDRDFGRGDDRVDVLLQPGWGRLLAFRDASRLDEAEGAGTSRGAVFLGRNPPVPGVRLYADGRWVATSGVDGIAEVRLARRPGRLEAVLAGWAIEGGGLLTGLPRVLVPEDALQTVWMEPR